MKKCNKSLWTTPRIEKLKLNKTKDNKHKSSTEAAGEKNAILIS